jgi:putative endonuclease
MSWHLYLLECEGGTYYAGITNNLQARFRAHQSGRGAKYTRANPPLRILASLAYPDRSSASSAEAHLKKLPRNKKPGFFKETRPHVQAAAEYSEQNDQQPL